MFANRCLITLEGVETPMTYCSVCIGLAVSVSVSFYLNSLHTIYANNTNK